MNNKYYAAYEICPYSVQIFESKEARDAWVHFKPNRFERTELSEKQAYYLIGENLYDESKYYEPDYCIGEQWVDISDGIPPIVTCLAELLPTTSEMVCRVY